MFIRKKLNKGGSFSILLQHAYRVAGKKYSATKIVKNFGSARGSKAIATLVKQASEYKAHLETLSPRPQILKIASAPDLQSCRSYNVGFSDVYGNAFDKVFEKFNFKFMDRLKDLVVLRIASPSSKRRTANIAEEYGANLEVDNIYKLMDQLAAPTIKAIKQTIYQHSKKLLAENKEQVDVLFYDLTTVYFETNTQDEIRDFGFSKDGKHQHVQIMLAVIVTKEGLPIDYEEFPGNYYEGHTLVPVLNKIKERHNVDQTVL